ncbi:methionine synthase [Nocardioides sp. MJB4]|uniref:Methionine synthase n=2 Tax=Nocardioides donggukensis TaxID=2774019 RepID=A0A927K296_9ACTN|nr:methionine synthase [Nocardioides donggukensis]
MTGRALAVVEGLACDLQPTGWRLTDAPGVDQRRARSLLARDLDCVEELTQGWSGPAKTQVAGPWTLAATTELPRGEKVLSDPGARRDLAQALAEGVRAHVADLRRRLPGVTELLLQVDEPALPVVLAGGVPTASGFGRHRTVHPPEASEVLGWVFSAIEAAGAVPIVHSCHPDVPVGLLRGAGARGLSVDVGVLAPAAYDGLAEAAEAGEWVLLGAVPALAAAENGETERSVTERVLRMLDMTGIEPGERTLVTPTCGLAGADPAHARRALSLARAAAGALR